MKQTNDSCMASPLLKAMLLTSADDEFRFIRAGKILVRQYSPEPDDILLAGLPLFETPYEKDFTGVRGLGSIWSAEELPFLRKEYVKISRIGMWCVHSPRFIELNPRVKHGVVVSRTIPMFGPVLMLRSLKHSINDCPFEPIDVLKKCSMVQLNNK